MLSTVTYHYTFRLADDPSSCPASYAPRPQPTCWPEKQMSGIWPRAVWGESGTCLHPGQLGQVPEMPHGPTQVIQDKKLSRFWVQMFLLIRNVCIYHPLLNELHLSTLDHHYPSIIKTNILQISYVPALPSLGLATVYFYSIPSVLH